MLETLDLVLNLATAAAPAGGVNAQPVGGTGTPAPGWFTALVNIAPIVLLVVVMYVLLLGPQRKKDKERKAQIATMSKGDKVVTIGGIIGTITSVDDLEVTLKVDENNNTKMKFSKTAIASVTPKGGKKYD